MRWDEEQWNQAREGTPITKMDHGKKEERRGGIKEVAEK